MKNSTAYITIDPTYITPYLYEPFLQSSKNSRFWCCLLSDIILCKQTLQHHQLEIRSSSTDLEKNNLFISHWHLFSDILPEHKIVNTLEVSAPTPHKWRRMIPSIAGEWPYPLKRQTLLVELEWIKDCNFCICIYSGGQSEHQYFLTELEIAFIFWMKFSSDFWYRLLAKLINKDHVGTLIQRYCISKHFTLMNTINSIVPWVPKPALSGSWRWSALIRRTCSIRGQEMMGIQ